MDRRKELKLAYKQNPPPAGVFQIKNLVNGKIFLGSGLDVQGILNRHRSQLKFKSHRNKALQQDWNEYGPEQFSCEVLEYLESNDDPGYDARGDLTVLEELWLEKLQPYGEKGYHKLKS
ncbi:transcriptional regulator, ArsR family [Candidatus Vecturithrix granuli]|uniref:Transcriptional regulator, ArsR family n=1 Tax=Vecturithrix granuli TaxID=1499967 RepID=A0A081C3E0_VECG1|nr:transcriptional regulator, ArsR family [Candidatus Vecturithrix granuli]